jgi:uncharacterized membrane protein (UPF0127 family)
MSRKKKMTIWISVIAFLAAIGIVVFYFAFFHRSCNPPLPRESMQVGNTTFDVEVASTMVEEACGLSGRTGLGPNQGMIFLFSPGIQSFWMKDMNFSLDMIWIGNNQVLGFVQNVPAPAPGTSIFSLPVYDSPDGTSIVLEVNAGTVAADNIKVGDPVKLGSSGN